MNSLHTVCLIVAAGTSSRCPGDIPKQYMQLGGIPILRHAALAFLQHRLIDSVIVIIHPDHKNLYEEALGDLQLPKPIVGGPTRQESVRKGLEAISSYNPVNVLIHDAARPLVTEHIIDRVVTALDTENSVIPVLPVEDTIKKCADGAIIHTIDRSDLFRAQTPQGFQYESILNAHTKLKNIDVTDDAAIHEKLGIKVSTVTGSQLNFKITTQDDLQRAERIAGLHRMNDIRTGIGFDVHSFSDTEKKDNTIILCGVEIAHPFSLKGHSDSDVGIHAVVDALLGSVSAGDIGSHFPPSDPQFKGMDSSFFLERSVAILKSVNAEIRNVDVTLICELPKIAPHVTSMRNRLASILDVHNSRVSVKATTTEGLGFLGRKEGIAAQAITTVCVKD